MRQLLCALVVGCSFTFSPYAWSEQQPADASKVSYWKDVAPLLQKNCVACHRDNQSEGGLNLETPKAILAGGDSGEVLDTKAPAASLLYARASGDEEPIMPPEDNTVGAKPFNEKELGLLRLWIEQGAVIDERDGTVLDWQPIPDTIRSTFALKLSPDNRFVAIGHANRVEIAEAASGKVQAKLVDPSLPTPGVADYDFVQAIAFSPLGDRIATGGYRTVRIWKQLRAPATLPEPLKRAAGHVALSPDRTSAALVSAIGDVEVWRLDAAQEEFSVASDGGRVTSLLWTAQQQLVIGTEDGRIRVLGTADGKVLAEFPTAEPPTAICASSDGKRLAVLGPGGSLTFIENLAARELQTLKAVSDATSIGFSPTGTLLVGRQSGAVSMIDVAGDKLIRELPHGSPVTSIATDGNGRVLTGGGDGIGKLWNEADGKALLTLSGNSESKLLLAQANRDIARDTSWVTELEKQTDAVNKQLESEEAALKKVVESRDKAKTTLDDQIKKEADAGKLVVDTEAKIAAAKKRVEDGGRAVKDTETALTTYKTKLQATTAALAPLEKQVATAMAAAKDAEAKLALATQAAAEAKAAATALAAKVTETKAAIAEGQKSIKELEGKLAASKKTVTDSTAEIDRETKELEKRKKSLADSKTETEKKRADLAEREQALVTSTKTRDRAADKVPEHQDRIRQRKSRLASSQLRLKTSQTLASRSGPVAAAAVDTASARIALVSPDGFARWFDANSGQAISESRLTSSADISAAQFLADGSLLCSSAGDRCSSVNTVINWELERTIGGAESGPIVDRVTALDFRRDGATVAIGSGVPSRNGQVLIVSVSDGTIVRRFDDLHSDSVLALRFSPDGMTLATGAADKTIRLVDVASGQVVGALDGHTHHVMSVAWKRDGRVLASASADKTVKIWDTRTGQQRRTISGFRDEVTSVEFLKDSAEIVSACADGNVRIHNSDNGGQVRNLSASGDFLFTLGTTVDGDRVIAGGQAGAINVWSAKDGKSLGVWK